VLRWIDLPSRRCVVVAERAGRVARLTLSLGRPTGACPFSSTLARPIAVLRPAKS
jgi:hypothetical protein